MRRFFGFLLIAVIVFSCSGTQEKRKLSLVLLANDSAAVYNGPIKENGAVHRFLINQDSVASIIDQNIAEYGKGLEVMIKPTEAITVSNGNAGDHLMMINMLLGSKNVAYSIVPILTEAECKYFNTKAIIDFMAFYMGKPVPLKLFQPDDLNKDTLGNKFGLNIWMINPQCIFSFKGPDKEKGKLYCDYDEDIFKQIISDYESSTDKPSRNIRLKPFENVPFEDVVTMLDRMTINKIKRYEMIDHTSYEQLFADSLINSTTNK
jgi:hypothetical protein